MRKHTALGEVVWVTNGLAPADRGVSSWGVVRHEQSYAFDDEEALARLRALTDYWSARHGVHTHWNEFSARLEGRKLGVKYKALVELSNGKLRAEVEVGFLAEKLGGPAYVRRKVADYLDPANSLESLRSRVPH